MWQALAALEGHTALPLPSQHELQLGLLPRLALFCAYSAAFSAWTYFLLLRRTRPGAVRLLAALPWLAANLALPEVLVDWQQETAFMTPMAAVFSLSAFKVLAACMGRGPLLLPHTGWWQFTGALMLPVIPAAAFKSSGGTGLQGAAATPYQLLVSYLQQMGLATLAAQLMVAPWVPVLARHWGYAFCSCCCLGGFMDLLGAAAAGLYGIHIAPSFNKPWLSTSFADYWARRWNLTTTYMLRVLVYEPVVEGRLIAPQQPEAEQPYHQAAANKPAASPAEAAAAAAAAPAGPEDTTSCSSASGLAPLQLPTTPPLTPVLSATELSTADSHPAAVALAAPGSASAAGLGLRKRRTAHHAGTLSPAGSDSSRSSDTAPLHAAPHQGTAPHASLHHPPHSHSVDTPATAPASPTAAGSASAGRRPRASLLRRYAALQATFVFSAVWHIAIFWYNTHVLCWRWVAFFSLQAPIVTVEMLLVKRARAAGLLLPRWLSVLLTNLLLIVIARPLFFGPADDYGFAARCLSNFVARYQWAEQWAEQSLARRGWLPGQWLQAAGS